MKVTEHIASPRTRDILKQPSVSEPYEELRAALIAMAVPHQHKQKARKAFIYNQVDLQRQIRSELGSHGWSHGALLLDAETEGTVRIAKVTADLLKGWVHAILDFGNRAEYSRNFITRVPLAMLFKNVHLTIYVTPMDALARRIDTNLVSFERVKAELRRLDKNFPHLVPKAFVLFGVDADPQQTTTAVDPVARAKTGG